MDPTQAFSYFTRQVFARLNTPADCFDATELDAGYCLDRVEITPTGAAHRFESSLGEIPSVGHSRTTLD